MTTPGYNSSLEKVFARKIRAPEKSFWHFLIVFAFACIVLLFHSQNIHALDPRKSVAQYVHDEWTTNDGLPQDSINAVVQTADGYIWFATQEGIVRFDGVRFTIFDTRNSDLINNFIFALYADHDGTLWAGGRSGLVSYRDGVFSRHFTDSAPFFSVKNISGDANGVLWLGSGDGGKSDKIFELARYKDDRPTKIALAGGLPNVQVNRTYTDRRGDLWIGTNDGLSRLADGKYVRYTTADGLSDNLILSLAEDSSGALWIGTHSGLNRYKDGTFTTFSIKEGLSDNRIRVICEDRDGNLWIGTDKGLNRYYNGRIFAVKNIAALAEDQILSILEDTEGSLWIGTHVHGLQRLRDGKFTPYGSPEGLLGDSANVIYEDGAGRIWIGTTPGGLSVLANGEVIKTYTTADGLSAGGVLSIYEDRKNVFWIGTSRGLNEFKDGKFTVYTTENGLAGDYVRSVYEDRAGALWISTNGGLSLFKNGEFINFTKKDGLATDNLKFTFEDRAGRLWIGGDSGLTVYENGKFTAFRQAELAEVNFQAASEDADGVLWFTSWGQGLLRLKNGELTIFTTKNGLYDDVAWSVLDDGRGNLWMGGNRGIFRVAKRELADIADKKIDFTTSVVYGTMDGMRKRENNAGNTSGLRSSDGKLWFATTGGAVIIDPNDIKTNRVPPPVIIEKIVADDRVIAPGEQNVELAAGTGNVEFQYVGLSFVAPERVRYKYKLEGFDRKWIDAETRHTAYYTNLLPGDYEFKVIAANDDGVWNERGASLNFRVLAPFWRTWWFAALIVCSLAGLGFLIDNRRVAVLKRAHHVQEAFSRRLIESQEQDRKRIAAELHDGLGQSLVIIKNRAVLSLTAREDHDRAFEQLDEIAGAATEALNEVKEITYNLRPYQLDRLGLTKAIESMLRRASSDATEFSFEIDSIDDAFAEDSEINVYRIVQESVNNIVKHANASLAKIRIERRERAIEITIKDNGNGFYVGKTRAESGGFGLLGITERTRILKGVFHIHSTAGKGTIINIKLPTNES